MNEHIEIRFSTKSGFAGNKLPQSKPENSLGKFISTQAWLGGRVHDLFEEIKNHDTPNQCRCLFIFNKTNSEISNLKLWITNNKENFYNILLGEDPTPSKSVHSTEAQALEVDTEESEEIKFLNFNSEENSLNINKIPIKNCKSFWIQRKKNLNYNAGEVEVFINISYQIQEKSYLFIQRILWVQLPTTDYSFKEEETFFEIFGSPQTYIAENPFDRVHIDFMLYGTTRVSWSLNPHFHEPLPYTFQLQFSRSGMSHASDWIDVGSPVVNTFTKNDSNRKWYGKNVTPHYRVKLTTGNSNVYYSKPATILGDLSWSEWRLAQEIIRKETLRHVKFTSVPGFLLKQIHSGPDCTRCLDSLTKEPKDSRCPICYGTRKLGGYFAPLPSFYIDMLPDQTIEKQDISAAGMQKISVIQARFLGMPLIYSRDLWVNKNSDLRYIIHSIKQLAHVGGVPIITMAELRLLPADDIAYLIPVPQT
jgi:hypothetical protein